jgi:thiol-disulfide isomerase/thioredoxin
MKTYVNANARKYFLWKISIVILMILGISACAEKDQIVINVDLKNAHSYIEGKKVFFGRQDNKEWLDSTIVKDGKFSFLVKTGDDFIPFEAAMLYETGDKNYPYRLLGYKNPYKERTFTSSFYVERGTMNLVVDSTSKMLKEEMIEFQFVNINKQTEAFYRSFVFSPKQDSKSQKYNADIIKKFPNSIALLDQLDFQKKAMPDKELKELLAVFDESVHKSALYQQLIAHINYKDVDKGLFPSDVTLYRPDLTEMRSVIDEKKYNLIVFWASWCGPCRKEIPQIRNLYDNHRNKLNIVSISVDKKDDAWQKALDAEKMSWTQALLKRDSSYIKFDKKFGLSSIPVWVLFDKNGKAIAQHMGLEEGDEAIDKKVVAYLNK